MSKSDIITFFDNKVFVVANSPYTGDWISAASCRALAQAKEIIFFLEVTANDTDTLDVLAVKVQEGLPGASGLIANDRVRFTDVAGDAAVPVQRYARLSTQGVLDDGFGILTDNDEAVSASMASGVIDQGPIADQLRYVVTITDADLDATFTATLRALIKT